MMRRIPLVETIQFRAAPGFLARLKAAADREGVKTSELLRRAAEERVERSMQRAAA